MTKSFFGALLLGTLSVIWLTSTGARAADEAKKAEAKCTIATKGDSPVAKACKDGGIKRANTVMKAMQKVGKGKGVKYTCDDCHKDHSSDNYALTKDAQENFKKLLAAQK